MSESFVTSKSKHVSFQEDTNTEKLRMEVFSLRLKCYNLSQQLEKCNCNRVKDEEHDTICNEKYYLTNIMQKYKEKCDENVMLRDENIRLKDCLISDKEFDEKLETLKQSVRRLEDLRGGGLEQQFFELMESILKDNSTNLRDVLQMNRINVKMVKKIRTLEYQINDLRKTSMRSIQTDASAQIVELRRESTRNLATSLELSEVSGHGCAECDAYKVQYQILEEKLVSTAIQNENFVREISEQRAEERRQLNSDQVTDVVVARENADKQLKEHLAITVRRLVICVRDNDDKNELIKFYVNELGILNSSNEAAQERILEELRKVANTTITIYNNMNLTNKTESIAALRTNLNTSVNTTPEILLTTITDLLDSISYNIAFLENIVTPTVDLDESKYVKFLSSSLESIKKDVNCIENQSLSHSMLLKTFSANESVTSDMSSFVDELPVQVQQVRSLTDKFERLLTAIDKYANQVCRVNLDRTIHKVNKANSVLILPSDEELSESSMMLYETSCVSEKSGMTMGSDVKLRELYRQEKLAQQEQLTTFETRLTQAIVDNGQLKETVKHLEMRLSQAVEDKARFEEKEKNIEERLTQTRKDKAQLEETVESFEVRLSQIMKNKAQLEEMVKVLEARNEFLTQREEQKRVVVSNLVDDNKKLTEERQELQSELDKTQGSYNKLQEEFCFMQKAKLEVELAIEKIKGEKDILQIEVSQCNEVVTEFTCLVKEMGTADRRLKNLFREVYSKFLNTFEIRGDNGISGGSEARALEIEKTDASFELLVADFNNRLDELLALNPGPGDKIVVSEADDKIACVPVEAAAVLDNEDKDSGKENLCSIETEVLMKKINSYRCSISLLKKKLKQKDEALKSFDAAGFAKKVDEYVTKMETCDIFLKKTLKYLPQELRTEYSQL